MAINTRTCFITGASRGLGYAMTESVLEAGHRVIGAWCSSPGGLQDLQERFPQTCVAVQLNQRHAEEVNNAIQLGVSRFGEVEVLVNNAAISDERPFEELDDGAWLDLLDVNLMGPVRMTRQLLTSMRAARWGRIINIASIGGQWGGMRQVHYAASKAALINFTRSLAKLYAGDGLVPIALCPGLFATDMTQAELSSPEGRAKLASIPSARLGRGHELGAVLVSLIGPAGDYLAGQTINLNGGMYFQT